MKKLIVTVMALGLLVVFVRIAIAQEDITPPVLVSVSFEPDTIDTSYGPQTITATARITDDLSGFENATVDFHRPGTTQVAVANFRPESHQGDDWYIATIEMPRYSAYGQWKMQEVMLTDKIGNYVFFSYPSDESNIGTEIWPARYETFLFTNTPTGDDQSHLLYIPVALR